MKGKLLAVSLLMALVLVPDAGSVIASDGVISTGAIGWSPSISGSIIAFETDEDKVSEDLNGDGDTDDLIIRYYDTATDTLTNTEAVGNFPSISDSIIAFITWEPAIGQDLDGNGVILGPAIRYYHTATGTLINIGAQGDSPSVDGSIIVFDSDEGYAGQDLNGDGDVTWNERVIRYYDTTTGTITNTGVIGEGPSINGSIIAFVTSEDKVSQDLNEDGDLDDYIVMYYDIATGTVTNTGTDGTAPSVSGSMIAFSTRESDTGQDLNNDGDIFDFIIMYYDIITGVMTNTGVNGLHPSASGSIISFVTWGQDVGDEYSYDDTIVRYYDTVTATVTNIGIVTPGGEFPCVCDCIIAFVTKEPSGGFWDPVIKYFTILVPETIENIQQYIDAFVYDGSIDNPGIARGLYKLLENAQASIDSGNIETAIKMLNAFIRAVQTQAGKHITLEAAETMTVAAQAVIDSLQYP